MLKRRLLHLGRSRPVEDIHFACQVQFLDESELLSVTYQKNTEGQYLIDHVCQSLDLIEKDYFGLRFVNSEKQKLWLDTRQSIHKQLKGIASPVLSFRVKFYPSDPSKLKEEITRYKIFLQLKRDLFRGRLHCSDDDANFLAACIVQSELGDYDADEHLPNYVSEIKCLPEQTAEKSQAIANVHKTLLGQVPAEAEANFLKKASELDSYGVDPFIVTDMTGNRVILGINHRGISTFQNNACTHLFKWSQIRRFEFEGRTFIVRLTSFEKKPACGFKCPSLSECKQLWKHANEQQYFFTLHSAADAPKVVSSGGFFHRGSKFRFSGRCQEEVHKSIVDITRKEPTFTRTVSNAQFVQRYNSLRSQTLPSKWRPHGGTVADSDDHGIVVMETSLDDSFQSSSGALKDEAVSSIINEDESLVVADMPMESPTVTVAEVVVVKVTVEPPVSTASDESCSFGAKTPPPSKTPSPTTETSPLPDVIGWEPKADLAPFVDNAQLDAEIDTLRRRLSETLKVVENDAKVAAEEEYPTDTEEEKFELEVPALPTADNETAIEKPPAETLTKIVPAKTAPKSRSCCRSLMRVFFVSLALLLVLMGLVLETQIDCPVVSDVRNMLEVQQFAMETYAPLRQFVIDQVGGLLGWE